LFPLKQEVTCLIVPSTHVSRTEEYISKQPNWELLFKETPRVGHKSVMLFNNPATVGSEGSLGYKPLLRVLNCTPSICDHSGTFEDLKVAFVEACTIASSSSSSSSGDGNGTVRIIGDSKVKAKLLGCSFPVTLACNHNGEMSFSVYSIYADYYVWGTTTLEASITGINALQIGHGEICKASHKIQEAFSSRGWKVPSEGHCLDVGASPGSWTSFLASNSSGIVVAVDPGDLVDEVLEMPNVKHVRVCATADNEESLQVIADALGAENKASVLVCDMNRQPEEATEAICACSKMMQPGGILILTLKLKSGKGKGRERGEKVALEVLERLGGWSDVECKWLFSNTFNESTVTARRI
jgi:hypothetical protein